MKRVALLLADERNLYQQLLVKEARMAAAASGIELLAPRFAGGLAVTQIEHFFECVRSDPRPAGVLITLVAVKGMQKAIEMIAKASLSCAFLNRVPDFLDQLRLDYPETFFTFVAPDQAEIGRIQGRQSLRLVPDGGFVLLVLGASVTPSAIERRRGFLEVVGSRITVRELEGFWTAELAGEALDEWLRMGAERRRSIDLIVCQNDQMARGVNAVLKRWASDLNRSEIATIPIIGCDGLPDEGLRMVQAKELVATIVMPTTTPRAIEILSAYWERGVRNLGETLSPSSFPPLELVRRA
jgi:ABC-type sugar transport system substrate-binding protein